MQKLTHSIILAKRRHRGRPRQRRLNLKRIHHHWPRGRRRRRPLHPLQHLHQHHVILRLALHRLLHQRHLTRRRLLRGRLHIRDDRATQVHVEAARRAPVQPHDRPADANLTAYVAREGHDAVGGDEGEGERVRVRGVARGAGEGGAVWVEDVVAEGAVIGGAEALAVASVAEEGRVGGGFDGEGEGVVGVGRVADDARVGRAGFVEGVVAGGATVGRATFTGELAGVAQDLGCAWWWGVDELHGVGVAEVIENCWFLLLWLLWWLWWWWWLLLLLRGRLHIRDRATHVRVEAALRAPVQPHDRPADANLTA
ncbi:hypothetical protein QJS10_CPB11g02207 [Acorus calamus]|uniref:Uncharacterized protein n=1 Tax=Acorus calamus TaxID=4465 RepID=A0AAV9DTF2_ACOCL|nr:hypothetical protein QJS10_CPB11g02207 [Acorus calamus]